MEIFRISATAFADRLTASGRAGRWNRDGQFVLYAGQSRSLATLELVVSDFTGTAISHKTMILSVPDEEDLYTRMYVRDLPRNWRKQKAYPALQKIGAGWYNSQKSLVLQVPSAVVPQEFNYIINMHHPDFSKVTLVRTEAYFWDERLV